MLGPLSIEVSLLLERVVGRKWSKGRGEGGRVMYGVASAD